MAKAYTPAQLKSLRTFVEKELSSVKTTIADTKLLVKPIAPDNSLGRLTRMDALNMKAVNEEALRMAQIKQTNLEKALPLIDTEGYGICTKCDGKIPLERLRIAPAVPICMACIAKMKR